MDESIFTLFTTQWRWERDTNFIYENESNMNMNFTLMKIGIIKFTHPLISTWIDSVVEVL